MKRVLSGLMILALLTCATQGAFAENNIGKGVAAIRAAMDRIYAETDLGKDFPPETFAVSTTESGDIVVTIQTTYSKWLVAITQTPISIFSELWKVFAAAGAEHTDAKVSLFIGRNDELAYFVNGMGVLDVDAGIAHRHE